MNTDSLPVAVIGAGPVGLAAAAHLLAYGQRFVVLEAGSEAGAAIRQWGHVTMFSPWRYTVDRVARTLLEASGWRAPDPEALPTGNDLVDRFVAPLAAHLSIAPHVRFNARVTSVGRKDLDKMQTRGRDSQPFELRLASGDIVEARAVIDASGTWEQPNPVTSAGVPIPAEQTLRGRIAYGIPDVLGPERANYAARRVLVVGSGHSAFNVILDLIALAEQNPGTAIAWAIRRENLESLWGGGAADALEARGQLGQRAKRAVASGRLRVLAPYRVRSIAPSGDGLSVNGMLGAAEHRVEVDRLIVCTGFRPDLDILKEVRLSLDPWLECASALGPLIDPNEHSCGTVRPHGARELTHPEQDFYIVGMKSYGRAPTFLLATGYEQARSVAARLSGDVAASERVELELPETGVCRTDAVLESDGCCQTVAVPEPAVAASPCCGGPVPAGVDACCVDDATAKASGDSGCGCGSPPPVLLQTK